MDDAIRSGLAAYASGDVESALKSWAGVDPEHEEFDHVREYLLFVHAAEPELFSAALGDFEIPGAKAPGGRPLPPPVHAPTSETVSGESSFVPPFAHAPPPAGHGTQVTRFAPPAALTTEDASADAPPPSPGDDDVGESLLPSMDFELPLEPPEQEAALDDDAWDPTAALLRETAALPSSAKDDPASPPAEEPAIATQPEAVPLPASQPEAVPLAPDETLDPGAPVTPAPIPLADTGASEPPTPAPSAPIALGDSADADAQAEAPPVIALGASDDAPPAAPEPVSLAAPSAPAAAVPPPWALGATDEDEIETEIELPGGDVPIEEGLAGGSAFDLVQQVDESMQRQENAESESLAQLEQRLTELSELDDLSGALDVAKKILAMDPEHRVARAAEGRSREVLMKMASSKIGDLATVPAVLCPPDQVIWLDLDHRSGFILSQVDGVSSYQEIMEIAGMDHLECALILAELVGSGVIGARG